jgi:phospho-N-acetylmuramoyl-pentapeptide-transferase
MQEGEIILGVVKVFGLAAVSFFVAVLLTPVLTHFLYKYQLWRKEARTTAPDGSSTPLFHELHKEREVSVPRMGGILIWGSTIFIAAFFLILSDFTDSPLLDKINFVSRNQTWLPLFTILAASLLGLADDILQVFGRGGYVAGGLPFRLRLGVVLAIALIGAYWFYFRLGTDTLFVPFLGDIEIGLWFIPLFITVMLATFSTSVTDGLDGLAGGVFASIFAAYGGIAFFQNQIDLAAFSAVLLGSLLAFLWFNIPPARFFMGDPGRKALGTALAIIDFY